MMLDNFELETLVAGRYIHVVGRSQTFSLCQKAKFWLRPTSLHVALHSTMIRSMVPL